ncbi:Pimeloyl-ACP methyl ester carboxylesterase [Psychrobacillus sp. OK028]|uniref:alpha/beta fold hydrolase n=1 Tax=Psychrobacillus sp. OK028 TaxID=1884359 RepID=UPI000882056C|nr:alpha/beta hydrolase [Psychrobacillus sp. OK028]SDN44462.1 Pimeloyl-ACP methyl ester carboxylesterase [Psychrobacillus sp. OK028]
MKTTNSNIAYKDEGQGEVLLLIHGFCGSSEYWNQVIPHLSENYRVIAIDLPGHGASEGNDKLQEIEQYALVIKDFIEELKIEKVTMFGHSLGGYITLAFAESYSDYLNGFSLIHSTGFPDSKEAKEGRTASAKKIDEEGITPFIDSLVPKLFAPANVETQKQSLEEVKKIGYEVHPQGAKNALQAMKDRKDRTKILENTELPVLLIAGENDQLIPADKTFTASGENIKQVMINGVGHMSMYEASEELCNAILSYIRKA